MIGPPRSAEASERPPRAAARNFHALGDIVGLLLALVTVPALEQSLHAVRYAVVLAIMSVLTWGLVLKHDQTRAVGIHRAWPFLLTSAAAGGVTYVIANLLGAQRTLVGTLTYIITWTAFMTITHVHRAHPSRILLPGQPADFADVPPSRRFTLTVSQDPPEHFNFHVVAVDNATHYGEDWQHWLVRADLVGVRIVGLRTLMETLTGKVASEETSGIQIEDTFRRPTLYSPWKRAIDIGAVLLVSPLVIPIVIVMAVIILVDSGRPVFFSQERVGRDGELFRILKLRTMTTSTGATGFAREQQHRITRTGTWMRQYRFDELPQLWDVLRGKMSLIGPRPEQAPLVERYTQEIPLYGVRHHLRPGITGWAQVRQGYAASDDETREKLRYDLYYLKNCSPILDLDIVRQTLRTIVTKDGAE